MENIGTVILTDKDMATVSVRRVSACGENCAHCSGACETTKATCIAKNTIGAKVGDTVKVESNSKDVIRAAVVLYMVPVLAAIFSVVVAYNLRLSDIFSVLICVVAFFVSFAGIKCFEKRLTPKAYITKIIGKDVK